MRVGDWSLRVHVHGTALDEHQIDGHTCVGSVPDAEFEISVTYHGNGHFMYKLYVDDKDTAGCWHWMDADRVTSSSQRKGPKVTRTLKGWEKTEGGHTAIRSFVFAKSKAEADEDNSGRPGVVDWSRGHITLEVYESEVYMVPRTHLGSHKADDGPKVSIDEATMVKSGLSTTAAAGAISFRTDAAKRAGDTRIRIPSGATGARRKEAELRLFYRDSFFMLLHEDKCCGGACAQQRAADVARPTIAAELRAVAGADAGTSTAPLRERMISSRETRERLARKRPAGEAPVDLTISDEDEPAAARVLGGTSGTGPIVVD